MSIEPAVDAARRRLGIASGDPLGSGGESVVYAMDADRVARIHRPGVDRVHVDARAAQLLELDEQRDRVPFAIPQVLETRDVEDCAVHIESRLPGASMMDALRDTTGAAREALLRAYLDASTAIGRLDAVRDDCRDLCRRDAVRAATPDAWAAARVTASLRARGERFDTVDGAALAAALPPAGTPALVHMDFFPGNVLCEGERVTAVIDFGTISARADPQLDPLLADVYLQDPMTPVATDADRAVAAAWLTEHGLAPYREAAERWTAAFWCVAPRKTPLFAWACRVLDV